MIAASPLLAPLLALALAGDPPLSRPGAPPRSADGSRMVQEDVARSEYSWSAAADGVWSAPNRAQDLRSRIVREGIEVLPRETGTNGGGARWKLALRTVAFGREGEVRPLGTSTLAPQGHRVERRSDAFDEWYVNDARGVEQGWTIHAAPPGPAGRPLCIELAVDGLHPRVAADGLSARLVDGAGELRLRYTGLAAWDAAGSALPVRMRRTRDGLAIEVRAEGARYPVTVDPVLGGPTWTVDGDQDAAGFGHCVSGAGDVNGDGYDDVLVGVPFWDGDQDREGRVLLFFGSPSGPSPTPDWTVEQDHADAEFGTSVACAGDVNGDGFDDVVVGAPYYTDGHYSEGAAFLYLGSASGPSLTPDWMVESNFTDALLGWSVAGAGDVNGDGYDDVIVGAPWFWNVEQREGHAFLYLGSPGGLSLTADWSAESDDAYALFGTSVSGAGDVDGDGFDDVIVGAHSYGAAAEGAAFLYLGSAAGPSPAPDWSAGSNQPQSDFGHGVSGAGDVNGDGFDDVIVGAPDYSNGQKGEGRVFLYLGSAAGPSLAPDWMVESDLEYSFLGYSVSGAGDVNGDGFDDVLAGAPHHEDDESLEGWAFLYLGSSTGPSLVADWTAEGNQVYAEYGLSASGAGDVNADGFDDVIVGARGIMPDKWSVGRVYVYLGDDGVPLGSSYCGPAVPNSSGLPGIIEAYGSDQVADNVVLLAATQLPKEQFGYFLTSQTQGFVANPGLSQGNLCLGGDVGRYAKSVVHSGKDGMFALLIDLSDMPTKGQAQVLPGETWNFQAWFRDMNPVPTSNFTDGVAVLFQ